MGLDEHKIWDLAQSALCKKLTLPSKVVTHKEQRLRGEFTLVRMMNVDFLCLIKNSITTANVGSLTQTLKNTPVSEKPVLLVANYISPTVADDLASRNINTLDSVGNCRIKGEKDGKMLFYLINKGEKNVCVEKNNYPAFQEAGLKVVFYLLQEAANVNKPYRAIQEATGVSLGAIKNVLAVLTERKFIMLSGGKRVLKNKNALLNLWVENYHQVMKPKLLLGKMSFRTDEHRKKWAKMTLPKGMYWGGESGANKIDAYLKPGAFSIYTDIPTAHLLKTGFVKQDEKGEIEIYQKFWKWDAEGQVAPLLLLYADLMGSGNSRCVEMAERLLNHEFEDYK